MEPEPDLHTGSGSDRLRNTASSTDIFFKTVLWIRSLLDLYSEPCGSGFDSEYGSGSTHVNTG